METQFPKKIEKNNPPRATQIILLFSATREQCILNPFETPLAPKLLLHFPFC